MVFQQVAFLCNLLPASRYQGVNVTQDLEKAENAWPAGEGRSIEGKEEFTICSVGT